MSKEPSMEEILSSIKRIIAEESEEAVQAAAPRSPRRGRTEPEPELEPDNEIEDEPMGVIRDAEVDEVLELTDAFDLTEAAQAPAPAPESPVGNTTEASEMVQTLSKPAAGPSNPAAAPSNEATPDAILSVESEVATRHSLSTLSAMLVKPQGGDDNTLEALVRELLRPMMKQWLDANLPEMVEGMVAKEIARITGRDL